MLNEFHFDHDFLENERLIDIEVMNEILLKKWFNFGCLYFPYARIQDYLHALELHDATLIQDWKTAFASFKHCNVPEPYKKVSEHHDLNEICTSTQNYGVSTTIVNKDDAIRFGIPNTAYQNNGVNEVVCNESIQNSHFFNESEKYALQDIPSGEAINIVWNTRFQNIAKHTSVITIIDRYLFANLEDDINVRQTSIKKFADFLRPLNKQFSLNIYSVGDDKNSSRHLCIERYLRDNKTEGDRLGDVFSYVELSSCTDEKFRDASHDRFVRFDNFVLSLGLGFGIFRSYPVGPCSFSVKNFIYTNFDSTISSMSPDRLWVVRVQD